MARKSARMVRAKKHSIVLLGVAHKVLDVETTATGMIEFTLDNASKIRRSPGAKLEVI